MPALAIDEGSCAEELAVDFRIGFDDDKQVIVALPAPEGGAESILRRGGRREGGLRIRNCLPRKLSAATEVNQPQNRASGHMSIRWNIQESRCN
jgi:hypothetical protein